MATILGLVQTITVLKLSTLLMSLYGTYSIGWAANDLYQGKQLELWAACTLIGFGLLLGVAALVTNARIPGGLPIAAAALLGLQALDVHNAAHLGTPLGTQFTRALFSFALLAAAFLGTLPRRRVERRHGERRPNV